MINTDVDMELNGPVIHNSWVMSRFGWLFGWQSTFDLTKMSLVRKNFAIGYQGPDFTLHTNVNDGTEVGASVYQRLNPQSELGMSLSWSSAANQTRLALAYKQQIDKNATFQAKVNNLNQVGLSYTQQLRDGKTFYSLNTPQFIPYLCIYFFPFSFKVSNLSYPHSSMARTSTEAATNSVLDSN